MNPKYINHEGRIYIFPGHIDHSKFAQVNHIPKDEITGAGFISLVDADTISCYGKSISLEIESTHRDTEKLRIMFRGY